MSVKCLVDVLCHLGNILLCTSLLVLLLLFLNCGSFYNFINFSLGFSEVSCQLKWCRNKQIKPRKLKQWKSNAFFCKKTLQSSVLRLKQKDMNCRYCLHLIFFSYTVKIFCQRPTAVRVKDNVFYSFQVTWLNRVDIDV